MCPLTILPVDVANHPRCENCLILLESEFNENTLCRCGKYHNAPASDPRFCRMCMGEEVPTGTPQGEIPRLEDPSEQDEESF